jgi:hypothetical protein
MANGFHAADWTVDWDGSEGTVTCRPYSARFKISRIGLVKIVWTIEPEPGPHHTSIELAAKEAAEGAAAGSGDLRTPNRATRSPRQRPRLS